MASAPGYPQIMVHPQHRAATISGVRFIKLPDGNERTELDPPGQPERFPNIEVHSSDQEEQQRARGYVRYGETMEKVAEFSEYPKMMSHPDHVDAVPSSSGARMEGNQIIQYSVPGIPEKFPDVMVRDAREQETWEEKGYVAPDTFDELAFEKATLAPGTPGDEWPKWVDGVLVQDPDAPVDDSSQYPKWLYFDDGGEVLVNDAAAEKRAVEARGSTKHEPVKPPPKPYVPPAPLPAPAQNAEYDEFLAWKAARETKAAPAPATEPDVERKQLLAEAKRRGIKVHHFWKIERLRDALHSEAAE